VFSAVTSGRRRFSISVGFVPSVRDEVRTRRHARCCLNRSAADFAASMTPRRRANMRTGPTPRTGGRLRCCRRTEPGRPRRNCSRDTSATVRGFRCPPAGCKGRTVELVEHGARRCRFSTVRKNWQHYCRYGWTSSVGCQRVVSHAPTLVY
jgi:hypothetical protein